MSARRLFFTVQQQHNSLQKYLLKDDTCRLNPVFKQQYIIIFADELVINMILLNGNAIRAHVAIPDIPAEVH